MVAISTPEQASVEVEAVPLKPESRSLRYWLSNWKLSIGLVLFTALLLFSVIGSLRIDFKHTRVGWGDFGKPPSAQYPLGTDNVGRDMLALMVHGIHPSLKIGLIAGILGTVAGSLLGFIPGYSGCARDTIINTASATTP